MCVAVRSSPEISSCKTYPPTSVSLQSKSSSQCSSFTGTLLSFTVASYIFLVHLSLKVNLLTMVNEGFVALASSAFCSKEQFLQNWGGVTPALKFTSHTRHKIITSKAMVNLAVSYPHLVQARGWYSFSSNLAGEHLQIQPESVGAVHPNLRCKEDHKS